MKFFHVFSRHNSRDEFLCLLRKYLHDVAMYMCGGNSTHSRMSTNSSGGLFDNADDSKDAELAFKYAVQAVNNQRDPKTDGLLEAGKSCFSVFSVHITN